MEVAATYRLQLGPEFDLFAAAELVDYLADLGVSHVYCSPFLQSAPDSPHGYAVVDHGRVDERLGGEEGRQRLAEAAAGSGVGVVLDLVPNHMAVSLPANRWFWEVLEHGRSSRYAGHFDVDWDPPESSTHDRVLLPVLGDHYGREVEAGAIVVEREGGGFHIRYHDQRFPASPRSVSTILAKAARRAASDELGFVARALSSLPPAEVTDEASRRRRHADSGVLSSLISDLLTRPDVAKVVDEIVEELNRYPDDLDDLLEEQHYRLARWQVSGQELGYRRFFDIDTLIGLRVEDGEVFSDSHDTVLGWETDGLRIDHPDGLRRPAEYLRRLREAAPRAWVVVEKILEDDEVLPEDWPVDGTTGYDFLTDVTDLLVDPDGEQAMTRLWHRVSGTEADWNQVAETAKREVLRDVLGADLNRLTGVFARLVERRRRYRDFTRVELSTVLGEVLVAFDVYRTYVTEMGEATPTDLERIADALERARRSAPDLDPELFDLLGAILTGEMRGPLEGELRMRFQQLTGPMMAKGVEDTAFYRYSRLAALCEVGGNPARFGSGGIERFHRRCSLAQERWPRGMLTLSTHDTKRSEDVRARLAVLSEMPQEWKEAVLRWGRHNSVNRPKLLDGATEYLIYQTLVGANPIAADRLVPYLEKATKESKLHTSWTSPNPAYDAAVADFAHRLDEDGGFQADLASFVGPVIEAGRTNSLTQKTIQLTAPGVPDTYQGTELWDLSLVDPDNRRPVDYAHRRRLLSEVQGADAGWALEGMEEGRPKLWVIRTLLDLRRRRPQALGPDAGYRPLHGTGPSGSHVVAYVRGDEIAVMTTRLSLRLQEEGGWGDTHVDLPSGRWRDVFAGTTHEGTVPVAGVLESFPVAVLERS
jgi:(1->4)-alpha-D-glucan 1-alpha-D-glucosylmutase